MSDALDEIEKASKGAPLPWRTTIRDLARQLRDARAEVARLKGSDSESRAAARIQEERERVLATCRARSATDLEQALRAEFAARPV